MGNTATGRKESFDAHGDVSFDHFQILRAIGKGSFGKILRLIEIAYVNRWRKNRRKLIGIWHHHSQNYVPPLTNVFRSTSYKDKSKLQRDLEVCIVQKRDTKKMYAMKYMNKTMCIKKDAVRNVFREVELLTMLDHPFLVNLWFTFQDEEDMFVVVDLLLGGDLRFHIQQEVQFNESHVKLYVCEIALALEYLKKHDIVHRDVKPDNILLDEEGHVHITDFNIATLLIDGQLATSMSGTTPYMAPEIFACALDECAGYSFPVDWWSLGVCVYEMLRGRRPYEIHSSTSIHDVKQMFTTMKVHYSSSWHDGCKDLIKHLLCLDPDRRICSLEALQLHSFISDVDFDRVLNRQIKPSFVPSREHLNCDPTYELEEMIIEAKPLHKKKKRLAKQNSRRELTRQTSSVESDGAQDGEENIFKYFKMYNREREHLPTPRDSIVEEEINHREVLNESFDTEEGPEDCVQTERRKIVKQVTFDTSQLTKKKHISEIGASSSFS